MASIRSVTTEDAFRRTAGIIPEAARRRDVIRAHSSTISDLIINIKHFILNILYYIRLTAQLKYNTTNL